MKKIITLLLVLGSLTGMAQKSIQNVGQVGNVYRVRGELRADSSATFNWFIKTPIKYKNNVALDSVAIPNAAGQWIMVHKNTLGVGGGSGISQAYADAHYMPLVTALTGYNRDFGTIANTVAQGNDSRILNGQTAFGWGNHASVGYYKASNFIAGTNYLAPNGSAAALTSFPTLNQNTTGTAAGLSATLDIAHGGTGQTSAANALTAFLPSQTGNNGKVLQTDGTVATWQSVAGGGGGTVVGVSVATAHGFNGAATSGSNPVITLGTPLIGMLRANGTSLTVATAGTDYLAPNGSAAALTGFPTLNQNTTGNAGTVTNGVVTTGSYSNPTWVTALAWAKITGAPAFLTGNQTITLHSTGGDVNIASTTGTTDLNGVLTIKPSVALSGIPTAPTASVGTNTTQLATTAFVLQNGSPYTLPAASGVTRGGIKVGTGLTIASDVLSVSYANLTLTGTTTLPNTSNTTLLADNVPLLTFGAGSAIANDTLAFTTSTLYGSVLISGSGSYVITSINIVLQGSSPNITVDVRYGATLNSGGTSIASTATTNTTTGTTTSVNVTVPVGNFIWCKTPTVVAGSKPTYMQVTLIGHKTRN